MEIKINSYDSHKNQFNGAIGGVDVTFDPFVSGILNGEEFLPEIEGLVGKTVEVEVSQSVGGTYLLTSEGEKQFKDFLATNSNK